MTKKWSMLAGLALTLAACTRASGGGATEPIETAAPTQSPAAGVSASPEVVVSTPASTVLDTGEFWAQIGGRDEGVEWFASLGSLIHDADLVVVGEVTEFRDGRRIVFPETGETGYMAEVRVRVSDTLAGMLISPNGDPGTVVVETDIGFGPDPSRLAELEANTPIGSRVLLFLVNKSADAVRYGFSPNAPYSGETYHFLRNGVQSAIRDEAGTAGVGPGAAATPWLARIKDRPFDQVVKDIRAAASAVPTPS